MLESMEINNFQSLQNINVEFGSFTVIVGASSSGKSALTRAIKAVAENKLASDNITRGAKHSSVTIKTDVASVTIERESGGSSAYKVTKVGGKEQTYSVLNRSVPTQVTEALGILPSTKEVESINFAGQFDTPYLLKESSSNVARILGELTNVSTIFAAVREANKRAKNASGLLNLRKKDLDGVVKQLIDYKSVMNEAKEVTTAEELLNQAINLQGQADQLVKLLERVSMASQALQSIREIPEVPDTTELVNARNNLNKFKDLLRTVAVARQNVTQQISSISEADSAILQLEDELHQTLVATGRCPLCKQEVE